jgi:hypothetical protein
MLEIVREVVLSVSEPPLGTRLRRRQGFDDFEALPLKLSLHGCEAVIAYGL